MTKYTAFRCPEDVLLRARAKANSQRRSLSNYMVTLIEKNVAGDPPLPIEAPAPKSTKRAAPSRPKKK